MDRLPRDAPPLRDVRDRPAIRQHRHHRLIQRSADVAVLGCDGLTVDDGLTTPHQLVAQIGATLIDRARRTIVVADSSNVGRRGFMPIAPIEAVDVVVTDEAADPAEIAALRGHGVKVVVV